MIKYRFPHGIQLKGNGKVVSLPVIPVRFYKNSKKIPLLLLIDSGAETTLLTRSDAKALGIDLKKGKEMIISGIALTRVIFGYRHKVEMEIEESKFEIPVLFADSDESPRVLGREGVFDKFFILFNEKGRQTIFILPDTNSKKKLRSILND